ncbi:acyl-CoA thioesterase domain-containing protein [Oricola sp.]|uniref:PaaI family thioesterase n=1 Tax=Oricola sp. TaxID=1979950 RepID=UPI0025F28F83|nr:acyl-CoA thioesterase domain-containing protein [Oricola sp.]MCI5076325.1 thioesterase family protein [Oricola sp.]
MAFGVDEAKELLAGIFAPWVVDLALEPLEFDASGGRFLLPANDRLVHVGGVVCGQATAAAADTCAVVTLSALNGRFRMCSTVDLAVKFMRPLPPGDAEIRVNVLSNGKRMAYTSVDIAAANGGKTAVTTMMTFAYLED